MKQAAARALKRVQELVGGEAEGGQRRTCISHRVDSHATVPKLHARPSVGNGRSGMTGRPSWRARKGAEARTCLDIALWKDGILDGLTPNPMKIVLETASDHKL